MSDPRLRFGTFDCAIDPTQHERCRFFDANGKHIATMDVPVNVFIWRLDFKDAESVSICRFVSKLHASKSGETWHYERQFHFEAVEKMEARFASGVIASRPAT